MRDKVIADRLFYRNLVAVIWACSKGEPRVLRRIRYAEAKAYYRAVMDCGDAAFWSGKESTHA